MGIPGSESCLAGLDRDQDFCPGIPGPGFMTMVVNGWASVLRWLSWTLAISEDFSLYFCPKRTQSKWMCTPHFMPIINKFLLWGKLLSWKQCAPWNLGLSGECPQKEGRGWFLSCTPAGAAGTLCLPLPQPVLSSDSEFYAGVWGSPWLNPPAQPAARGLVGGAGGAQPFSAAEKQWGWTLYLLITASLDLYYHLTLASNQIPFISFLPTSPPQIIFFPPHTVNTFPFECTASLLPESLLCLFFSPLQKQPHPGGELKGGSEGVKLNQ